MRRWFRNKGIEQEGKRERHEKQEHKENEEELTKTV